MASRLSRNEKMSRNSPKLIYRDGGEGSPLYRRILILKWGDNTTVVITKPMCIK